MKNFMQNQIIKDRAYQVETTYGTEIVPFHVAGSIALGHGVIHLAELQGYCEGKVKHAQVLPMGYVYRLSAPGYLDCTPWGYASTEPMAIIHLRELYGNENEENENEEN